MMSENDELKKIKIVFKDGSILSIDDPNWIFALKTKLNDENLSFDEFERSIKEDVKKHWENKTVPTKWPWNWSWERELEDDIWHRLYHELYDWESKKIKETFGYPASVTPVRWFDKEVREKEARLIRNGIALTKDKKLIIRGDTKDAKIYWKISNEYGEYLNKEVKKEFEKRKKEAENKFKTRAELAKHILYHYLRGRLMGIILSKATDGKLGGIVSSDDSVSIIKHNSVVTSKFNEEDKGFKIIKRIKDKITGENNKSSKKESKSVQDKKTISKKDNKTKSTKMNLIFIFGIMFLLIGCMRVLAFAQNLDEKVPIESFKLKTISNVYSEIEQSGGKSGENVEKVTSKVTEANKVTSFSRNKKDEFFMKNFEETWENGEKMRGK